MLRAQTARRRVAIFPALYRTSLGTWLATFQVGACKHATDSTIGMCRSRDGGVTWTGIVATTVESCSECARLSGGRRTDRSRSRTTDDGGHVVRPQRPRSPVVRSTDRRDSSAASNSGLFRTTTATPGPSGKNCPRRGSRAAPATGPILQWSDGTIAYALRKFQGIRRSAAGQARRLAAAFPRRRTHVRSAGVGRPLPRAQGLLLGPATARRP